MIQMTTSEYAELRGLSKSGSAIRKAIMNGQALPGVLKRAKFGRSHILYVDPAFIRRQKKSLKKVA